MIVIKGKYSTAVIMIDSIDAACMAQINKFVNHPAFTNDPVVMPDCQAGKGSVVGFTMPLNPEKVIPNVVGVDQNCGMLSFIISTTLPPLEKLDNEIRNRIPFGTNIRTTPAVQLKTFQQFWKKVRDDAHRFAEAYYHRFGDSISSIIPDYSFEWFERKCRMLKIDPSYAYRSLGTLGGGNHYSETGRSEKTGHIVVTVHSGSRNLGKCMCEYWQGIATKDLLHVKMDILDAEIRKIRESATTAEEKRDIQHKIRQLREKHGVNDKTTSQLAHLKQQDAAGYLFDLIFTHEYARLNRATMMKEILEAMEFKGTFSPDYGEIIESIHNYVDFDDFVIRKGAIKSYTGQKMIIPLNTADGILICEGKSNSQWNYSAPHGAGRLMSRAEAKRIYEQQPEKIMAAYTEKMAGIFSSSVCPQTIDESPMAYKDPAIIEAAIEPTALILDRIRPIINLKDKGDGFKPAKTRK